MHSRAPLTKQQLKGVPVTKGGRIPQADLERIVEGMGSARAKVSVSKVDYQDDETATVTLKTSWTFKGSDWNYTTPATLAYEDDEWRVKWSPAIVAPKLTADEELRLRTSPADRGDIVGARGEGLVIERRVERIGIDKSRIKAAEAEGSARALAQLVDINADRYAKAVKAAGPQAFVVALVVRADSDDTLSDAQVASIPGAVQLGAELPLAPTKTFGQPLLGAVGEATAEVIAKSKGSVTAGDLVGLTGLEQRYDSQLRGAPGVTVEAVAGSKARDLFSSDARAGKNLRTTIDLKLQGSADKILADVKPASAIVAMRPSSGKIVALASGPGGKGADTAAAGHYAPGSTFKLVTALTFLRSGPQAVDHRAVHADRHGRRAYVQELLRLPGQCDRQDPAELGDRPLVQHRDDRDARQGAPGQAGPGRRRAGARAGPRPRLPGLPRLGADAGQGHRARRLDDRPGQDRGLAARDGRGRRLDRQRLPGHADVAGRLADQGCREAR